MKPHCAKKLAIHPSVLECYTHLYIHVYNVPVHSVYSPCTTHTLAQRALDTNSSIIYMHFHSRYSEMHFIVNFRLVFPEFPKVKCTPIPNEFVTTYNVYADG